MKRIIWFRVLAAAVLAAFVVSVPLAAAVINGPPAGGRPTPQAVGPTVLQRPEHGFSIAIPSGWQEQADDGVAAAMVPAGREDVAVMVFIRLEDSPADVETAIGKLLTKLAGDASKKIVSRTRENFLKRSALVAIFDDDTSRYRMTILPRDTGATSQVFYAIMAISPIKDAQMLVPVFDSIRASFLLTAMASPKPAAQPPTTPPAPRPVLTDAQRAAMIDRLLAPKPADAARAALQTTKEKDRADGMAAYERALVFVEQGAWAEAEKELNTTGHKDDDNIEFLCGAGYVLLKRHKPDDALDRFQHIYKLDPKNMRALVGMAAAYEEAQNYREAVRIWQRYTRMTLPAAEKADGTAALARAQDLFARYYEIAENPGGGAPNALTPQQEMQLGQNAVQQMGQTGLELVRDTAIDDYVKGLCQLLVSHTKGFPSNYQVYVIDTAEVNAFTIPGYIFINRGLLAVVDSESELAGVVAHEIGHSVAHHSGKKLTKQATDQQTAAALQNSNNKFLRWMGAVSATGAVFGELSYSREAEDQADRLAVHISYDSGLDPRGFAGFFQKLESLAPSSRSRWDLALRTHPFSIDRLNTINAYIDLLPEKRTRLSSPAFDQMKARLGELPPAPDATGQLLSSDRPANPPTSTGGLPVSPGTRTFNLDRLPFGGEIPSDWGGRKTEAGTFIFEGPQGTESYEVSIEIGFEPKRSGFSIDDVADEVQDVLRRKTQARIDTTERRSANDGTPMRFVRGTYAVRGSRGAAVPIRHTTVVFDYPGYFVLMSYFTPDGIFEKYQGVFQAFAAQFRYTGR